MTFIMFMVAFYFENLPLEIVFDCVRLSQEGPTSIVHQSGGIVHLGGLLSTKQGVDNWWTIGGQMVGKCFNEQFWRLRGDFW